MNLGAAAQRVGSGFLFQTSLLADDSRSGAVVGIAVGPGPGIRCVGEAELCLIHDGIDAVKETHFSTNDENKEIQLDSGNEQR